MHILAVNQTSIEDRPVNSAWLKPQFIRFMMPSPKMKSLLSTVFDAMCTVLIESTTHQDYLLINDMHQNIYLSFIFIWFLVLHSLFQLLWPGNFDHLFGFLHCISGHPDLASLNALEVSLLLFIHSSLLSFPSHPVTGQRICFTAVFKRLNPLKQQSSCVYVR